MFVNCDITIICTSSRRTTPTTQQPQSSATTRLGGYYSSSLANIYAVEARLRTGKAQNTAFDRRHSCRSTVSGAAHAETRNR